LFDAIDRAAGRETTKKENNSDWLVHKNTTRATTGHVEKDAI